MTADNATAIDLIRAILDASKLMKDMPQGWRECSIAPSWVRNAKRIVAEAEKAEGEKVTP